MPDLDDVGDAVGKKVGPFPLWVWVALGAGALFLFLSWNGNRKQSSSGSNTFAYPESGGGGGATQGEIQDLRTDLQATLDERFGQMTEANADALAGTQQQLTEFMSSQATWFQSLIDAEKDDQDALIGAINTQGQSYKDALATSNSQFLSTLENLLASYKPNGTAPPQSGGAVDPLSGLPQWAKEKLADPTNRSKAYLVNTYLDPKGPYGEALHSFFRSDSASGLNTGGVTAGATSQLNSLVAQGLAVKNPFFG